MNPPDLTTDLQHDRHEIIQAQSSFKFPVMVIGFVIVIVIGLAFIGLMAYLSLRK